MDELHQDGIVAGFFIYPAIEAVEGEKRTKQMLRFMDDLQEKIRKQAGDDVVAFLGGYGTVLRIPGFYGLGFISRHVRRGS